MQFHMYHNFNLKYIHIYIYIYIYIYTYIYIYIYICIAVTKKRNLGIDTYLSFHSFSLRINQVILKEEFA